MNRVKRAIIMAAGVGSRMRPLTNTVPKPLVKVNGVRMIDTVIQALHDNDIYEIVVVVGYLKECFANLPIEYPGVRLVENPWYESCNNISSLYVAKDYLSDVFILDGDQLIYDSTILEPHFELSGYSCIWTDKPTNEWLMTVENGIVKACSRTGGVNGWQLFSISRWSSDDGNRLRKHLEEEFIEKENRQIYWDDVAMFCHPEAYQLGFYPINPGTMTEIDSLAELVALDSSYSNYLR